MNSSSEGFSFSIPEKHIILYISSIYQLIQLKRGKMDVVWRPQLMRCLDSGMGVCRAEAISRIKLPLGKPSRAWNNSTSNRHARQGRSGAPATIFSFLDLVSRSDFLSRKKQNRIIYASPLNSPTSASSMSWKLMMPTILLDADSVISAILTDDLFRRSIATSDGMLASICMTG